MTDEPRIVAVGGSLRDDSYTRMTLARVVRAADAAGGDTELLDLREYDLPPYDPDRGDVGDAPAVKRAIRRADGVALGSPVYHGSYSSPFRTVHDYCGFDEYEDTVVGLVAVAGGGSYGATLEHMRATVRGVHGWVLPHQVGVRNASGKFEGGALVDGALADRVDELGEQLVEYAPLPAAASRCPPASADD